MEKIILFQDKQTNLIHFSFFDGTANKGLCSTHVGHIEGIDLDITNKSFIFIQNFEKKVYNLSETLNIDKNFSLCEKCQYILQKKINIINCSSVTIEGVLYPLTLKNETHLNIPASLIFQTSNKIREWISDNIKFSNLELKKNSIAKVGEAITNKAMGDARNIHLGF